MGEPVKAEPKRNYQKELDCVLEGVLCENTKPSLLLHSCCGPCSSYCLSYLNRYFKITVFYYNPNIDPIGEYEHRLSEQKRLINSLNEELSTSQADAPFEENPNPTAISLIEGDYDHNVFLHAAKGLEAEPEGGKRCEKCFSLRLEETFRKAKELGFDYYGTTLTVSPHKNAILINNIGAEIAQTAAQKNAQKEEAGHVLWLPSDFKKKNGYQISIELSKKYDLYRQDYCGCEFARKSQV